MQEALLSPGPPPAGFSCHREDDAATSVLVPDGWFVRSQAERRGRYREQCQREVFLNGSADMTKDKQFKKLAPLPFKDGVWVDEDCLAQFHG